MAKEWPVQRYTDVTCGVKVTVERYADLLNRDDPDVRFRYSLWGCSSIGSEKEMKAAMKRGEQKAQFTAVDPVTSVPRPAQAWVNLAAAFGGGNITVREGGQNSGVWIRLPDGYDDVSLEPENDNKNVTAVVTLDDMSTSKTFAVHGGAAPVLSWIATARKKLKRARTIQEEAMRKTQALGIEIEVSDNGARDIRTITQRSSSQTSSSLSTVLGRYSEKGWDVLSGSKTGN